MFFRPSFCANCGEKIERADWKLTTSRRFCPVCESEFKGTDLIPRAIVAASVVIGLLGFGTYLQSGNEDSTRVTRQIESVPKTLVAKQEVPIQATQPTPAASANVTANRVERPVTPAMKPLIVAAEERTSYCGAETKKGTPCSRRVKGNVRCYQHDGMPAMEAAKARGETGKMR